MQVLIREPVKNYLAEMDQKGHITDQKGLKMYEKRQKMEFSDLKYLLFSGIFLSGFGGNLSKTT